MAMKKAKYFRQLSEAYFWLIGRQAEYWEEEHIALIASRQRRAELEAELTALKAKYELAITLGLAEKKQLKAEIERLR